MLLYRARPHSPLRCLFLVGNSEGGIFFDHLQKGNKSREAEQDGLRQIVQMRRTHGAGSDLPALLGEAARPFGAPPVPPPLPDLGDPGLYLDFFGQILDFAVSPHKSRRPLAIGSGIYSKAQAWEWICDQICMYALCPEWRRRSLADQLGAVFAELFHKIGVRRLPISFGPAVAPRLVARWKAITDLRIEEHRWVLASDDPALKEYCENALRNASRARIRLSIEKFRRQMDSDSLPQDEEGNITNEPPDDELSSLAHIS